MKHELDNSELLRRLSGGDERALAEVFSQHRERLWRMVNFRMDRRLHGRLDADDVLQEAYLAAVQRLPHYFDKPGMSLFIWLRLVVQQTLIDVHRRHLEAQMRSADREVSVPVRHDATSMSISFTLLGNLSTPSQAAMRDELAAQLERALEEMSPLDREVLALRHFEDLSNNEIAELLNIDPKAASIRYVRAIGRLKKILSQIPGFLE